MSKLRLGVNVDHVATLRNARGEVHPDPVAAALVAIESGADGITVHLREDRRHIRDADVERLKASINRPLNLEIAATEEMVGIACKTEPNAACLVPEKREEITTEGGLDVANNEAHLKEVVAKLREAGIRASLFIEADAKQIEAAARIKADIVEFHTGAYCNLRRRLSVSEQECTDEFARLRDGVSLADSLGIECHAGHGLSFDTVQQVASLSELVELNIGHFLIGESVFEGLGEACRRMRQLMDEAREQ